MDDKEFLRVSCKELIEHAHRIGKFDLGLVGAVVTVNLAADKTRTEVERADTEVKLLLHGSGLSGGASGAGCRLPFFARGEVVGAGN